MSHHCQHPPKWVNVYPQGTKEGDEEQRFFIALARHPKYQWRSVTAIATEAKLTETRTEEILQKYFKKGMVIQNPKNPDNWGYWERNLKSLSCSGQSISKRDKESRIDASLEDDD